MATSVKIAADSLAQSQLATPTQMELLGGDVDIDAFHAEMYGVGGIELVSAITDVIVDRTIEGASTVKVALDDSLDRAIQRSGRLGRHVDVNIDGLWWTLVQVSKASRAVTLTFEEREVNILRYYNTFISANRDTVTRAQFVLRMIKEVKEISLKYEIPELNVVQPILGNVPGPNQSLVDASGAPLAASTSPSADTQARARGLVQDGSLTVKGATATSEQLLNASTILQVGESIKAPYKVLVCSIQTAITESTLHNYLGDVVSSHMENVGVYQQDSRYWPASRDVATDAKAWFQRAIATNQNNPDLTYAQLCQAVQHSAFSDGSNYAPWQTEAEKWVAEFDNAAVPTTGLGATIQGTQNYFTRGTIQQQGSAYLLTKENSWAAMQRLAQEVQWRCFCVSGIIYFMSDQWLFNSKPFMTISEDSPGVDWLDYDFDEGKKVATVTGTIHLSRWSAPPGSIVRIVDMGVIEGNWLVQEVSRSLFDTIATVTMVKPQPVLPEPINISSVPKSFVGPTIAGKRTIPEISAAQGNAIQKAVVLYVQSQLGVPYKWGTEVPGIDFDCSGLTQAAYGSAGLNIPRTSQEQFSFGKLLSVVEPLQPGDLVFFVGSDGTAIAPGHVGIYIGNSQYIDAPFTGAVVRVDILSVNGTGPNQYVGATRPWLS